MANLSSAQNQTTNDNVPNGFQMEGDAFMTSSFSYPNETIFLTRSFVNDTLDPEAFRLMSPNGIDSSGQNFLNCSGEVTDLFEFSHSQMYQEWAQRDVPVMSSTPLSEAVLQPSSLHYTRCRPEISPSTNQIDPTEANRPLSSFMGNSSPYHDQMYKIFFLAQRISQNIRCGSACHHWVFSNDVLSGSAPPPISEQGKVAYHDFIKYFQNNCSQETVKYFCDKLSFVIREKKLTKTTKEFLQLFWKRVELVVLNKNSSRINEQDGEALLGEIGILLEENDLLGCVENLLRITMSAENFLSLFVEPSNFDFNNEASSASSTNSDTPIYLNLIQLLMISHSPKSIGNFFKKLNLVVCLEEEFDCVQKRLVFFWKRVLWLIKTKFAPGEVEFSGNFLTEIENFLDEICEECDLVHLVNRIVTSVVNSNSPCQWKTIFQKEDVLIETMGDHAGRAAYCKFIRRLHFSHSEESVHRFCDELSQAICNEIAAGSDIKKRLLIFWNRVLCLIQNKLSLAGTEFKNLLDEIRKTFTITLQENQLILCSMDRIIQALDGSNNQCNLTGIFDPEKNASMVELAPEEIKVRVAYIDSCSLLKLETSEDSTQKFCNQLYETLREKSTSNNLREICILFWKKVLSFFDDIPTVESGVDCSNQILDTILDLLDDTFFGGDISYLPGKILKNLEGSLNQTSLEVIFRSDVVNHKPPSNENNRLHYYRFIQRLKFCNGKEKVRSFCDQLHDNIKSEKNAEIVHTLLTIFWIKVECSIKDDFAKRPRNFYQQLLLEIGEILKDTFGGDNCLTKFSACHACCNCFCIQCATWFHEWYYKKVFRNSLCLRKHCPNILDKCCTPTCYIIGLFFAIITTVTILFAFLYYFKLLIMDWLFQM